jgi:hypothetical protein
MSTTKEIPNLGIPGFLTGVTPAEEEVTEGWYSDGRIPHRADGRPSKADFLPAGMLDNQTVKEEFIMASVKTPGATLSTQKRKKTGLNNLNKAKQTGFTPPKSGGNLS